MTLAVAPVHYYNAIRADSTTLEYVIFDTLHSCFGIAALGTTRSAIDKDVRDRLWLFSQLAQDNQAAAISSSQRTLPNSIILRASTLADGGRLLRQPKLQDR